MQFSTHRLIKTAIEACGISIDLILENLLPDVGGSARYDRWALCAVILHTGTTFDSGHYVTAFECIQDELNGERNSIYSNSRAKWVLVDDDREARWLSDDELCCMGLSPSQDSTSHASSDISTASTSTPYLLFYVATSK